VPRTLRRSAGRPATAQQARSGGRTWWAHFEFTRINIEPIILKNKFEDLGQLGAFMFGAGGVGKPARPRNAAQVPQRSRETNEGDQAENKFAEWPVDRMP